jgi:hypothetical protein
LKPSWWTISRKHAHVYRLGLMPVRAGEVKRLCLLSDLHWDNAHARLDLLKAVLDQAIEGDVPVFLFGDTFCAMQGRWDPRASQESLRPEHRGGEYLDRLVETAIAWFKPYRDILAFASPGNHEATIRRRHETDLTSRFVGGLRAEGARTIQGTYWGFIQIIPDRWTQKNKIDQRVIHYHHGWGGGGPVSRGLIDHNRTRDNFLADIYVSGHIHRRNQDENVYATLSSRGNLIYKQQLFLRSSCWKDEMKDEWHSGLQGRGPRPIGGWWLDLHIGKTGAERNYQIEKMVPVLM